MAHVAARRTLVRVSPLARARRRCQRDTGQAQTSSPRKGHPRDEPRRSACPTSGLPLTHFPTVSDVPRSRIFPRPPGRSRRAPRRHRSAGCRTRRSRACPSPQSPWRRPYTVASSDTQPGPVNRTALPETTNTTSRTSAVAARRCTTIRSGPQQEPPTSTPGWTVDQGLAASSPRLSCGTALIVTASR